MMKLATLCLTSLIVSVTSASDQCGKLFKSYSRYLKHGKLFIALTACNESSFRPIFFDIMNNSLSTFL